MTVSSTTAKAIYAGNGQQTQFPTVFKFLQNADVKAILRDASGAETTWSEGTHYTLAGAGNEAGGTLTVITTPTDYTPLSGETLTLKRAAGALQETDLPAGGSFPSGSVEAGLDLLTMLVQQHDEAFTRTLLLPESTQQGALTMPEASGDGVLKYTADGSALEAVSFATLGTAINVVETTPADNDILVRDTGAWRNKAPAAARAAMGLGALAIKSTVAAGDLDAAAVATVDIGNDQVTLAKLAGGAADQVLTTDGSGNPQYESKSALFTGRLLAKQVFTTANDGAGAYIPTAGAATAVIEAWGGGGGGGSGTTSGSAGADTLIDDGVTNIVTAKRGGGAQGSVGGAGGAASASTGDIKMDGGDGADKNAFLGGLSPNGGGNAAGQAVGKSPGGGGGGVGNSNPSGGGGGGAYVKHGPMSLAGIADLDITVGAGGAGAGLAGAGADGLVVIWEYA